MRKFLKYIALFLLPVLLIAVTLEIMLRRIPNDFTYKKQFLDAHAANVNALFLGNSHAYFGINPEFITKPAFNAAYQSQSLQFDLGILKMYDGQWKNLKTIVVPISYHSLYTTLESGVESWRVKDYTLYYGLSSSNRISDYAEILNHNLKVNLKKLNAWYAKGEDNIGCSKLGWGMHYWGSDTAAVAERKTDLQSSAAVAIKRQTAASDKHFKENMETLKQLISYAKQNNLRLVFYTPPAFHTYTEQLDKTQIGRTTTTMKQLAAINKENVIYTDFLGDQSFSEQDFADADHLSEQGAEKFSRRINTLIN